jgi:hypothetical protein
MNRKRPLVVLAILLALSIVTALIIDFITGSASADTPSTATKPRVVTSSAGGSNGSHIFQTTGTSVRIRQDPTTGSAIITTLGAGGTSVTLSCYVAGQSILGDAYWYRTAFGTEQGYISGYWVDTGRDPAAKLLPACS